ncbi:CAP domain-containing protein [Streptomyces halobius]|uniref:CAP domain-containing protein n=1 Tax=Streptomyces halobius TaxID=2879846 RepID=A0ABY4MIW8_9ACTN|nr:CAP domain-containing protein [Streptomyces halobius]UQA97033.1 CAP domain-containing protein [Streptomyces halobius]
MAREAEAPANDPQQPRQTAGRHGRRRGAHRGRRPRWVVAAGGVAAVTVVLGGGYGVTRSLADDTSDAPRAAAEAARQAETGSIPGARSAVPDASPTPSKAPAVKPHRKVSREQTAAGRSPSPRTTAKPKTTSDDETGRPRTAPHKSTPPGGSGGATGRLARQVVEMVNAERAKKDCSPLTVNAKLQAAAQGHSDDMADRGYYGHTTPEGIGPGDRITSAGYRWSTYGENIFKGPKDAQTAMAGWMKSPGHRDNILNCAFKEIGVGINLRSNGPWWTQNFGASS